MKNIISKKPRTVVFIIICLLISSLFLFTKEKDLPKGESYAREEREGKLFTDRNKLLASLETKEEYRNIAAILNTRKCEENYDQLIRLYNSFIESNKHTKDEVMFLDANFTFCEENVDFTKAIDKYVFYSWSPEYTDNIQAYFISRTLKLVDRSENPKVILDEISKRSEYQSIFPVGSSDFTKRAILARLAYERYADYPSRVTMLYYVLAPYYLDKKKTMAQEDMKLIDDLSFWVDYGLGEWLTTFDRTKTQGANILVMYKVGRNIREVIQRPMFNLDKVAEARMDKYLEEIKNQKDPYIDQQIKNMDITKSI